MNKKLVAAAIAAAMAAPAAYADATVYGQLKVHLDSVDTNAATSGGETMSTSGSRLGFKGSEDLGNGMKAVFKLEYGLNFDDPTAGTAQDATGMSSRSQYVGLAGNFGTVMFGKRETNYLLSTVALDVFGDTLADYNNLVGFDEAGNNSVGGGARPNNAIHYVSPAFSGVTVSAGLYTNDGTSGTSQGDFASDYDVAVAYSNAGIYASIAHYNSNTAGAEATRVGLGYKMDAFTVAAVYENDQNSATSENNRWMINGTYTMGNNTIKAMYGTTENGTADNDSWAIGVDHKLSKRTKVYALYADTERDLNSDNDAGAPAANAVGDQSGFSLGMQHNF